MKVWHKSTSSPISFSELSSSIAVTFLLWHYNILHIALYALFIFINDVFAGVSDLMNHIDLEGRMREYYPIKILRMHKK